MQEENTEISQHCENCDYVGDDREYYDTRSGLHICSRCYEDDFFTCERCGDVLRTEDEYDRRADCCSSCASANEGIDYREVSLSTRHYISENAGVIVKSLRKFGVELEMCFPDESEISQFSRELPDDVGVESDGSIRGDGIEIQTPPASGEAGEKLIAKVCSMADSYCACVDDSCGYHLHIDCDDITGSKAKLNPVRSFRSTRNLWLFYIAFEDVIMSFLPDSRRKNRYCSSLRSDYHFKEIANADNIDDLEKIWYRARTKAMVADNKSDKKHESRYRGINMHTLLSGAHLEIRFHSGTINPRKILEWANLHLRIVDIVSTNDLSLGRLHGLCNNIDLTQKTEGFFSTVNLSAESEAYFRARQRKFMKESEKTPVCRSEDNEARAEVVLSTEDEA